jgi:hypothetical protein
MASVTHLPEGDSVFADINYVRNAPIDREPGLVFYTEDESRNTMQVLPGRRFAITNARPVGEPFSLEQNGFQLCRLETGIQDFRNIELDQALADEYCAEIEKFLLNLTGGALAIVRRDSLTTRYGVAGNHVDLPNSRPVRFAHSDNTNSSAAGRALQSAVNQLKANGIPFDLSEFSRYAFYNVWRCVSPAPQDIPLAVCDARTVDPADEITVTAITTSAIHGEIVHDTTGYKYNPQHRWYYYRDMSPNEVLVFKTHDSERALRRTPHTAFDDPSCPAGVQTRNSVELRAAVFFR